MTVTAVPRSFTITVIHTRAPPSYLHPRPALTETPPRNASCVHRPPTPRSGTQERLKLVSEKGWRCPVLGEFTFRFGERGPASGQFGGVRGRQGQERTPVSHTANPAVIGRERVHRSLNSGCRDLRALRERETQRTFPVWSCQDPRQPVPLCLGPGSTEVTTPTQRLGWLWALTSLEGEPPHCSSSHGACPPPQARL